MSEDVRCEDCLSFITVNGVGYCNNMYAEKRLAIEELASGDCNGGTNFERRTSGDHEKYSWLASTDPDEEQWRDHLDEFMQKLKGDARYE